MNSDNYKAYFTIAELSLRCNLQPEQVVEYIENGVITSDGSLTNLFSIHQLTRLHKASRLKKTMGIEAHNTVRALTILENIDRLEKRACWMKFVCTDNSNETMQ